MAFAWNETAGVAREAGGEGRQGYEATAMAFDHQGASLLAAASKRLREPAPETAF